MRLEGLEGLGNQSILSDTSVEVTYEVKMADISRVLLPMADKALTLTFEDVSVGSAATPGASSNQGSNADSGPTSGGVTGIIIDGKGLGLRPAMSPRIMNQSGSVVYGPGRSTAGTTQPAMVW